jgi:predicted dehydrogenase
MIPANPAIKTRSNLAFVGTGWIGLNRMMSLLQDDICNPVAIVDPDEKNARKAADLAPGAVMMNSLEEVIMSRPDGIVIATPSSLHAGQCLAALENGIPVFCQKPLARTAAESLEVITAANKSDRLLGVDLSYRYTDGMQKVHSLSRNELGDIFAVDLVFNNAYGPDRSWFYNPRLSGGGCLIDLGVHLIDLALWILDFPAIRSVSSALFFRGKMIPEASPDIIEDYASAQMETENGTVIRLVCSWNLSAGKDADISACFYGTKASALFYNLNGSFYDFEAAYCHGTSRKIISSPPDDWGGKALIDWTRSLQISKNFRKSAYEYYETASVMDRIYRRQLTPQPALQ